MWLVIVGGIVAASGGLLTHAPNGLSLLGVLVMVAGVIRLSFSSAYDAR
jgi:hypothetical protein